MRRTNSRKRNKINIKNIDKKTLKTIYILSALIVVFLFAFLYFLKNVIIKYKFEKIYTAAAQLNEDTVFTLDKIVLFSSATVNTNELKNSVWNINISQFSDICVYLNNIQNTNNSKNIIKELYIDNISFSETEFGTPIFYKKNLNDFGKCTYSEDSKISDRFNFNIISKDSEINYYNNEIYNNLSTPLTIGFYNKDIKSNFLVSASELEYNGKILKRATIARASINCNVSFDIHIINELNEEYICNVNFDIPFDNSDSSIYEDGYITKELNNLTNYKFLRLK